MKKTMQKVGVVVAAVSLWAAPAFARSGLSLVGDMVFSSPSASMSGQTINFGAQAGFGGGVLLEIALARDLGLEVGGLYISRKYDRQSYVVNGVPVTATFSAGMVEIPALLKVHLAKVFTLGAGGYYAFAAGGSHYSASVNGTSVTNTTTYGGLGLEPNDWGVALAAGFEIPLSPAVSALAEARLTQSLKNSATTGSDSWKYRDLQVLAGLKFEFGGYER